jgi:SAM-dependent methyltransferase
MTRLVALLLLAACGIAAAPAVAQSDAEAKRVAPYAATPDDVVTEMLKLARVGPADYVVDLGSGDGRLVIAAVKQFGARGGFGVDINRDFVAYANAKASEAGLADRARFYARDLFETEIAGATVVTVYLLPAIMGRVSAKLRAELAPGTRVVSHDFPFPDWTPDRIATVASPEKKDYTGRGDAVLLLYTVPERAKPR